MPRFVPALLLLVAASPAVAQEKLTVAQVIAKVRENEVRYDDLEVRYVATVHHVADGAKTDLKFSSAGRRTRSVRQKGMLRVEEIAFQEGMKEPDSRYTGVFDGTAARVNRDGAIETPARGVRHDEAAFQPHNLAIGLSMFAPLSVWLGSGPELRQHPGARIGWDKADIRPRLAGRERVRGIDCEKVACDCFFPDGKGGWERGETITLWLSPAHNYLVVQEECVKADTPAALHSATACEDFREVRPGQWVPFKTTMTRYDRFAGNRIKDNVTTTTVESVRLDPAYPIDSFRDTSLPRP